MGHLGISKQRNSKCLMQGKWGQTVRAIDTKALCPGPVFRYDLPVNIEPLITTPVVFLIENTCLINFSDHLRAIQ